MIKKVVQVINLEDMTEEQANALQCLPFTKPQGDPTITCDFGKFWEDVATGSVANISRMARGCIELFSYTSAVRQMERHLTTSELFSDFTGPVVMFIAPPGDLCVDKIIAVRIGIGQSILLAKGVWHFWPRALEGGASGWITARPKITDDAEVVDIPGDYGLYYDLAA